MDNIIHIEFYNKKNFPPGEWHQEPDVSRWIAHGMQCIAIRDMTLGTWQGYVGVSDTHLFHEQYLQDILGMKEALDIFLHIHGGICHCGYLFTGDDLDTWWIGMDAAQKGDLMPLAQYPNTKTFSTYRNFKFIRNEVNKLAYYLSKI